MTNTEKLTLGPLHFNWDADKRRDFYFRMADEAPVDSVCIGETICLKRFANHAKHLPVILDRLEKAGKQVIHSTLTLVMTENDRTTVLALAADKNHLVEANDATSLSSLVGRPHTIGPQVNVYNEGTLQWHTDHGAQRICLPPEVPLKAIAPLAMAVPQADLEYTVFDRLPLAISARCYHARVAGRTRENCGMACTMDPDGLQVDTLDGRPFLAVNGIQTLSAGYALLLQELDALKKAGIKSFRLSPHTCDMVKMARLFRDTLDGRCDPGKAFDTAHALIGGATLANGYIHGIPGGHMGGE